MLQKITAGACSASTSTAPSIRTQHVTPGRASRARRSRRVAEPGLSGSAGAGRRRRPNAVRRAAPPDRPAPASRPRGGTALRRNAPYDRRGGRGLPDPAQHVGPGPGGQARASQVSPAGSSPAEERQQEHVGHFPPRRVPIFGLLAMASWIAQSTCAGSYRRLSDASGRTSSMSFQQEQRRRCPGRASRPSQVTDGAPRPERVDVDATINHFAFDLLQRHALDQSQAMLVAEETLSSDPGLLGQAGVASSASSASPMPLTPTRSLPGFTSRSTSPLACAFRMRAPLSTCLISARARCRLRRPMLQRRGLEIATRDVAHRQEHGAVHLARLVNRNHVRMLKRGRHPRLA